MMVVMVPIGRRMTTMALGDNRLSNQSLSRAVATLIVAGALLAPVAQAANENANTVAITVYPKQPQSTVQATAIGINTATWSSHLMDAVVPSLLRAAGVKVLRYPGGSWSDIYHWQTNTLTKGQSGTPNPMDDFSNFMKLVQATKAQAMITVNYGSNPQGTAGGSPTEAAAWVRYATAHHDGVKLWEIGNELYGNGTYGNGWEEDLHADKGPAAYAKYAKQFITAMKKVNPTIKVGVVLTAPGNWPDGQTPDWNNTVLRAIGSDIDFVDVHWYAQSPGQESDAGLLQSTGTIPGMVTTLQQEIQNDCGANAKHVKIMLTETNSVSYNPGKQTVSMVNALFLADDYASWLSQGVANVDWWDLYNGWTTGTNNATDLFGTVQYGDYGVLSAGDSAGQLTEPPASTPFPTYYGLVMLSKWIAPGDTIVNAVSAGSDVIVHAAAHKNHQVSVLVENESPLSTQHVVLSVRGWTPRGAATVYWYGPMRSA